MSQTYMTAKLNLTDGTIVYPQVSLDNVVNSIDDPTLATIATGISISVNGGTATLVTNGGSGVAKFVGANGLVVSMNEGNEVVFTAPTVSEVGSAAYADNAGSATHATSAGTADTLVSGYVVTSATNATSAGTAAAIASGAIVGGYKTEIISGNTIGQAKWFNIVNATGATVTVEPGEAYKINATNSAVTISATLGTVGQWGQEGHAEIFVAGTGNVHTGANVTLADGLEPDSVNNCTLRFHDGKCIISVEDHVAGYIVVSATGTSAGSLYYGLGTASESYIAVDATLNSQTLDLGGVVTSAGEKHVVGNGYQNTIVSGGINCTSKTTFANLGMNNVTVSSGTLTLGDVYIPNGSTVAVSGGGLAVEKVTGAGETSVIDLGGTNVNVGYGVTASAGGCTFSGGSADGGGAFNQVWNKTGLTVSGCTVTHCSAGYGGAFFVNSASVLYLIDTVISGNFASTRAPGIYSQAGATVYLTSCDLYDNSYIAASTSDFIVDGHTKLHAIIGGDGKVSISSGAVLDLTGNSSPTPIAPGGGVTFAEGGATVYPSAGQASAYMLGGMTVPQIGSTNVVNLNSSNVVISSGGTASASGCTFSGGYATIDGGGMYISGNAHFENVNFVSCSCGNGGGIINNRTGTCSLSNCIVSGGSAYLAGGIYTIGQDLRLVSCTISGNTCYTTLSDAGDIYVGAGIVTVGGGCNIGKTMMGGGTLALSGENTVELITSRSTSQTGTVTISSGAILDLTGSINPGGGITVLTGGCTVNGVEVAGGTTYSTITSSGGSAVVS